MFDTVLFDMDGTLLATLDDLHASVNYALAECGLSQVSLDETRLAAGYGSIVLIDETTHHAYPTDSPEFKRVHDAFTAHYNAHHNDTTKPYDGIPELLDALNERGAKLAIVSNKADRDVEQLRRLWFADSIPMAVGRVDGIPPKPAPDMVFKALERMGSTADRAIYIGDSEPDAQVGKAAGCTTVCCTWGFRDRATLAAEHPDYLIDEPLELLSIYDGKGAPHGRN
ncbi:MAG: HAD family hydrolase [Coriobacteriales bacterium]